ncbi:HAD family hydrolase [Rhodoferax bucti]|uniref:HAD family hydrolase n=1 Tax=Rhodoferax bucti TaxID=2576305 RepID=UPI001107F39B|nr:HAD family hydrolase [Rhodoferax bucti]
MFDLDETLVHATKERLDRKPDFRFEDYGVFIRPHLRFMLEAIAPRFDIAVWSSATKIYVESAVKQLFGDVAELKFAWSIDRCVQRVEPNSNGYVYIKDLRKVQGQGYAVEGILIVDDSPEKIVRQPRNHVLISAFTGAEDDDALLELPARLVHAAEVMKKSTVGN